VVALNPRLAASYIQQWFPGLQRRILRNRCETGAIVERRYDLYDPASWRSKPKHRQRAISTTVNGEKVNGDNVNAVVDDVNNRDNRRTNDHAAENG
jgi:hypothetical protein